MGDKSKIEWTDATWNPITGCTPISAGCDHCYAKRLAESPRLRGRFGYPSENPFCAGTLHANKLDAPLRWKRPRKIFVCSMGDLFHEAVSNELIAAVFGVMAAASQHTFMVLTKRPDRAMKWFEWYEGTSGAGASPVAALAAARELVEHASIPSYGGDWPLPNVWFGVTAENQEMADERIPVLLQIPAAVRFVSIEPMLGPVDLDVARCDRCGRPSDCLGSDDATPFCSEHRTECSYGHWLDPANDKIDWVICGGETGPGARPMAIEWARSLASQCDDERVPFFFKKVGKGQATPDDLQIREWPENQGSLL